MNRIRRGFTLIELITVIAVSSILLGIIIIPVIQGFNLTRAAQGFSDAQERARLLISQLEREIGNATQVRDTSGVGGQVNIVVPVDADYNGVPENWVTVRLDYAKMDLLFPSEGDPAVGPSGALVNPNTGMEDPTLRTPQGDVNLPVAPGLRMVRYFVGLRNPLNGDQPARYNNPYDGMLMRRNSQQDNLYVLYRAEMELRQFTPGTGWQVNPVLDLNGDGRLSGAELDDPNFFLPDGTVQKADRIRAWLKRSRVATEVSRFDMIMPIFDRRTRQTQYFQESANPSDPTTVLTTKPRIQNLITLSPTRIASEPAEGQIAVRSGEESDNMQKIGPDVFMTDFASWSNIFMRMWPSAYRIPGGTNLSNPWDVYQPWESGDPYLIGRARTQAGQTVGFSLYHFPGGNEAVDGTEIFDATEYVSARDADPAAPNPPGMPRFKYPFSHAVTQADGRSGWLANAAVREDFIPFVPDRKPGKAVASFAITEVGNGTATPPAGQDNRPRAVSGPALTPDGDPAVAAAGTSTRWQNAAFSPSSATSTINQRFNCLWRDWNFVAAGVNKKFCSRYLDLRLVRNFDGEASPLHPTEGFPRARIVPGSENVFGPDQIKGDNYGNLVRYTRATTEDQIGPNQYFINYVNQREPDWAALGFTVPPTIYDPTFYDPNSIVSAILQPRYRAGFLKFNSDFDTPLADGNIFVSYRFQFTEPNDVLAVDYDSRQKMHITLTIRMYPQTTLPNVQNVTLTGEATVRNYTR